MRAKFKLTIVESHEACDVLKFKAVTPDKFGPEGESDDNTYARWTPSAELSMNVTNPNLLGQFKPGQKFYVDFTPAENSL